MTKAQTSTEESARKNELVELLVPAAERPRVARALLDATDDPWQIASTSTGYVVPRGVAEAADLILAPDAGSSGQTPVYTAAADGDPLADGDDQAHDGELVEAPPTAVLDADTDAPTGGRRATGRRK